MPDHDNDRKPPHKDRVIMTLAEKVKLIQERAEREGFASTGSDDKPFMDEAWGEES